MKAHPVAFMWLRGGLAALLLHHFLSVNNVYSSRQHIEGRCESYAVGRIYAFAPGRCVAFRGVDAHGVSNGGYQHFLCGFPIFAYCVVVSDSGILGCDYFAAVKLHGQEAPDCNSACRGFRNLHNAVDYAEVSHASCSPSGLSVYTRFKTVHVWVAFYYQICVVKYALCIS